MQSWINFALSVVAPPFAKGRGVSSRGEAGVMDRELGTKSFDWAAHCCKSLEAELYTIQTEIASLQVEFEAASAAVSDIVQERKSRTRAPFDGMQKSRTKQNTGNNVTLRTKTTQIIFLCVSNNILYH